MGLNKYCKRIKRVTFRRSGGNIVVPYNKIILEKVEKDAYLVRQYSWLRNTNEWIPCRGTCYFDGKELVEIGKLVTKTNMDVDRYFQLLVEYEKFTYMQESEEDKSTSCELEYLKDLSKLSMQK